MNELFGFFIIILLLGVNGLFYYAAYACFKKSVDKREGVSWQVFNVCYCMMSFGAAGAMTIGIITMVLSK